MKEGASASGAEQTESVAVRPLDSDAYISFIIPIQSLYVTVTLLTVTLFLIPQLAIKLTVKWYSLPNVDRDLTVI